MSVDPLNPLVPVDAVCGYELDGITPITVGEFRTVMAEIARLAAKRGLPLVITDDPVTGEPLCSITDVT